MSSSVQLSEHFASDTCHRPEFLDPIMGAGSVDLSKRNERFMRSTPRSKTLVMEIKKYLPSKKKEAIGFSRRKMYTSQEFTVDSSVDKYSQLMDTEEKKWIRKLRRSKNTEEKTRSFRRSQNMEEKSYSMRELSSKHLVEEKKQNKKKLKSKNLEEQYHIKKNRGPERKNRKKRRSKTSNKRDDIDSTLETEVSFSDLSFTDESPQPMESEAPKSEAVREIALAVARSCVHPICLVPLRPPRIASFS